MALFTNAANPLTTPSHDGSGQAMHPQWVDLLAEHGIASWGGYRHWVAMTPYTNSSEAHEDPNVIASNDLSTWVVPNGITNPLSNEPGGTTYNADTEIVYDPFNDRISVFWLKAHPNTSQDVWRSDLTYADGVVTASTPRMVYTSAWLSSSLSPCIWVESATRWHMWSVGSSSGYKPMYQLSTDGGESWGAPQVCTWPAAEIGSVWHLSVKPNAAEGILEGISLKQADSTLRPFKIPMDNLTSLESFLSGAALVGLGQTGAWDAGLLYRSTWVREDTDDPDGYTYHLMYSGRSAAGAWHIGITSALLAGTKTQPPPPEYDRTLTVGGETVTLSQAGEGPHFAGSRFDLVAENDPSASAVRFVVGGVVKRFRKV